jgi:hypothetical protein
LEARPLRYEATCAGCGTKLAPKTRAVWNKERREATCEQCVSQAPERMPLAPVIDRGTPGASAMREGLRRQERRETQTLKAHPRIGKLILALSEEPQSTRSWKQGAGGEQALGGALEQLRDEGFGILHDRQIPGTRANIDHLVVGPAGVFVIDAKRYTGKIERRDRGWFLERDWRLYVNGRDQTKLAQAMPRQVAAVRSSLASTQFLDICVIPVLCFVDSQWGLGASPFVLGEVRVMWPKMLYRLVRSEGSLERDQIEDVERLLAHALPRA